MKNKKVLTCSLVALIAILFFVFFYSKIFCEEVRYSFDFGSGAIKLKAASVNFCEGKINKVFFTAEKFNKLENCFILEKQGKKRISEYCIEKSKSFITELQQENTFSCKKEKCVGIATAWARKADNAKEVLDAFRAYGINLKTITQEEEGIIAFYAVLASYEINNIDINDIIVWDIGGGSFQFSTLDSTGEIYVYKGKYGVESYENKMRRRYEIPSSIRSPYLSDGLLEQALKDVTENIGAKIIEDPVIGRKLKSKNTRIFAIGGPMAQGLKRQLNAPSLLTQSQVYNIAYSFEDKSPHEMQKIYPLLSNHYLKSAQASCILIYGIMNGANISQIQILDATMGDYILTNKYINKKISP